jgi:glycosyltransferase involved in cell wall biosynthesis
MKRCAIFLSNEIYFDSSKQEGGVRICTEEYLKLIKQIFEVEIFEVRYYFNLAYRLRVKLGLNIYNDYKTEKYTNQIADLIKKRNVEYVFLNLSNTAPFSKVIKNTFGSRVKVVLCSHGNESGDYLHAFTRFKSSQPYYKTFFSSITIGSLLKKESYFRQKLIDAVLTVSPIEESLEKWLGAAHVLMVPRIVTTQFINRNPVLGRVGFIGDLSHAPNYFGIDELCKAIALLPTKELITLRLVGSPAAVGKQLEKNYPFVNYLDYMDNNALQQEVASWTYFLNPVFYYSRGVSTKLAKALGWGLPVISTDIGCRGYEWERGSLVIVESPADMANAVLNLSNNAEAIAKSDKEVKDLIATMPNLDSTSNLLSDFLDCIS